MELLYVDDCQSWIIKSNHSVFSETALQVSMLSNCLRAYSTVNILRTTFKSVYVTLNSTISGEESIS
jgi:hypothetical protein